MVRFCQNEDSFTVDLQSTCFESMVAAGAPLAYILVFGSVYYMQIKRYSVMQSFHDHSCTRYGHPRRYIHWYF